MARGSRHIDPFRDWFLPGSERNLLLTRRGLLTRESENLICYFGWEGPACVSFACRDAETENPRFAEAPT